MCLGGKTKENVEGLSRRMDVKLQEMDNHMNQLRYLKGSLYNILYKYISFR